MSDLWERRRAWGIALVVLVAVDGLSGALYTNLSLATPNWGLHIRAGAENAWGATHGNRGIKSAAYYVRTRIPKEEKIHVNAFDLVSELYFDRQLCKCGGRGKKTLYRLGEDLGVADVDWFVEYNLGMDSWGRVADVAIYESWARRTTRLNGKEGHLAAVVRDGDLVLVKVFTREPVRTEILEHGLLVVKFNWEFMTPDRFFTNRLGGMTFWME